jgi:conjugative relaxase-like TrwC/TraI family protein
VLNIGQLATGGGEYYVGEVATSAEDYYTGRGESAGRWVGSVAKDLGLEGDVDPAEFRRVLDGRDPHSGDLLISAAGSSSRKAAHRDARVSVVSDTQIGSARVGAVLGVHHSYVRSLLAEGRRYEERRGVDPATLPPRSYLIGTQQVGTNGNPEWVVAADEIDRFRNARKVRQHRAAYDLTLRPPKSVSVLWALGDDHVRAEVRAAHTAAVDETVLYVEHHAVRARQKGIQETHGIVAAAFDHRTSRAGDPLLHTHVVAANMTQLPDGSWRTLYSPGLYEHAKAGGYLYQAHLRHELQSRLGVEFTSVVNGTAEVDGVPDEVIRLFSKRRQEIEELIAESGTGSARSAQIATLASRSAKEYGVDPTVLLDRWRDEAKAVGFEASALTDVIGRVDGPSAIADEALDRLFESMAGPHGLTAMSSTFTRADVTSTIAAAVGASLPAGKIDDLAGAFLGDSRRALAVDRLRGARPAVQQRWTAPELLAAEAELLRLAMVPASATVDPAVVLDVLAMRPELSAEQSDMVVGVCLESRLVQSVEGRPGAGKTYATEAVVAAHMAAGVPILGCAVSAAAASELESQAAFGRSTMEATTIARMLIDIDRHGLAPHSVIVVDEASMASTRDLVRLAVHASRVDGRVVLIGDPDQHGAVEAGGIFARLCADDGYPTFRLVENRRQRDHGDRLAVTEYREGQITDALARLDAGGRVVRCASAGEVLDAMTADWYAARLAGGRDPMIAGPNSTRRALNERARVMLDNEGALSGRALVARGREFRVGEEIVCRRNARQLKGDGAEFVKNGSVGVVVDIDHRAHSMRVRFDSEGTITIPASYLDAGHVDYAYARTTYGVQGQTHEQARYLPTDLSGFEEGYVALTRGTEGTKVFILEGDQVIVDDESHGPDERRHRGLDEVSPSLGRRRSQTLATRGRRTGEISGRPLAEVSSELRNLSRIFESCPPEMTTAVEKTQAAIETLAVKSRAWASQADAEEATPSERLRAANEVRSIEKRTDRLSKKLSVVQRQEAEYAEWTSAHAGTIERIADVRAEERGILAAISADPDRHLGPERSQILDASSRHQADRLAIERAKVGLATYLARWEPEATTDGPEMNVLVGVRPSDPMAFAERERVIELLADAPIDLGNEVGLEP